MWVCKIHDRSGYTGECPQCKKEKELDEKKYPYQPQQGLSAGNAGYVATGVRYLPKQEPRVETGNVQFGDDWTGLFLRGDTCAGFVMDLQTVLEGDIDPIIKIRLKYLLELLQGTNESRLST